MSNPAEQEPQRPTEFDLLQRAMESYSTLFPGDDQSEETGVEIAKIQDARDKLTQETHLPKTGFTSKEWGQAMRLMIIHGLNPTETSTQMLQYFQKQYADTIAREKTIHLATSTPKSELEALEPSESLIGGLMISVVSLALGGVVSATNVTNINDQINIEYPFLSQTNNEAAKLPPILNTQSNVDLLEQLDRHRAQQKFRNEIFMDKLTHRPQTWAGAAGIGLGALGFGGISLISLFRTKPKKV